MKFDKNKAFPYPVLRPYSDDFFDSEFQSTVDFVIEQQEVSVEVSYALSSSDISDLIADDKAEFVTVISCRDTYFSTSLKTNNLKIVSKFDDGIFRGEVEVKSYVLIKNKINFVSGEIHQDFGPGPFAYTPGDIIAQDETAVYYFDRELFRPVTSVFDLVKKVGLDRGVWELRFDQDRIQIQVSPEMKETLDRARNLISNRAVLLNSIYFAAVMEAVEKLRDPDGAYEDYKWAHVFRQTAHNNSVDLQSSDSYLITQRLMKSPMLMLNDYVFKAGANDEA